MKDLIVYCNNPEALDKTLQQMGALVMQNPDGSYPIEQGGYRVRTLTADINFIKFAIGHQGYGKVVSEVEEDTEL